MQTYKLLENASKKVFDNIELYIIHI